MIPSIFEAKAQGHDEWSRDEKAAWSRSMSGALIGFAGAVGALSGVFINVVLRASYVGAAKSATNANSDAASATHDQIVAAGGRATVVVGDIRDRDVVAR